ncbi:MAG: ferritin [Nocardioidaceae bacterium]
MQLNKTLDKAFSEQITMELQAATTYLQLAIELENLNLNGMASWMRVQSDEERMHADKFIAHALDRGNCPTIGTVTGPKLKVKAAHDAFRTALEHERTVSAKIRDLYRLANKEGDLDCIPLLDWFLSEQVEEESTVDEIVGRLELIGDDGGGLLRLDSELGGRNNEA